jgi:MtN3 and saliva related transmembrane protein
MYRIRIFSMGTKKGVQTMIEPSPWVEGIGTAAGLLTTFSASPQLLTTYRTRDVRSFDLRFLVMLFVGLLLWAAYGVVIGSASVAVFNTIGCLLWLPIVWFKVRSVTSQSERGTATRR